MMTITEKAAYIKGLAQGMELDPAKKETKIINALIDIIDDIALSLADAEDDIAAVRDDIDELEEHIDAVDADLADVEDELYGDDDGDYCGGCDSFDEDWDDEDEDEDDSDIYEIECPECGEVFTFDESAFETDDPLTCPKCGYVIDEIEEVEDDE